MADTATRIPHVSYLHLDPAPHLVASKCNSCGATFFDRRNACAGCFQNSFTSVDVPNEGTLRSFSIVTFAAPGVPVPFVAAVVDCGDIRVRANLLNVAPDPEQVKTGMALRLTTTSLGVDDNGVEAIAYGYEPA